MYTGTQIENIRVRLTAACHTNYKWIPITDNISKIELNIHTLPEQIAVVSHAYVQLSSAEKVASAFLNYTSLKFLTGISGLS